MNEVKEKNKVIIGNLIYEVCGKQVILDSEISATKLHDYLIDKIITHYDIGLPISVWR